MQSIRSHIAFLLLVAFATGGVLLPSLHEIEHGLELAEERLSHVPTDDHHHHEAGDNHGVELQPPCSEGVDTELSCVLCQGISVVVADHDMATKIERPNRQNWQLVAAEAARGNDEHVLARGPPTQIA